MPKELTHWILAEQAMNGVAEGSRLNGIIRSHHDLYLAGAVLPDTLLYLHRGPYSAGALSLAKRFHDSRGNSFAPLIQAEVRYQEPFPEPLLACLLGVISHMRADINFHPFIYARSGRNNIGLHYRLETDLDQYFLSRGQQPPLRLLKRLLTPGNREVVISACALIFDPENTLPCQALEQALAQHCQIQAMYDSFFWKMAALLLSGLCGEPYRTRRQLFYPLIVSASAADNDFTSEWRHPVTGEEMRVSLEDLAAKTVRETVNIFRLIEESGSLSAVLNEIPGENLLTGMNDVCEAEMTI